MQGNMNVKWNQTTEWATKNQPAFRFARVLATILISVFTLCYGPGLISWPILYKFSSRPRVCVTTGRSTWITFF